MTIYGDPLAPKRLRDHKRGDAWEIADDRELFALFQIGSLACVDKPQPERVYHAARYAAEQYVKRNPLYPETAAYKRILTLIRKM